MLFDAVIDTGTRRADPLDEQLLAGIAREDPEAFTELYRQARSSVFAFALSMLRSRQEAEDVTQDTFLKVRAAAHLYEPRGKPMAWILTITRNLCLMRIRRQRMISPAPPDENIADMSFDRIENAEDRMAVKAALRVLTGEESRIIMLHAVSGLRHREIASLLGLPLSTVLSRYNRGLKKLKQELQKQ